MMSYCRIIGFTVSLLAATAAQALPQYRYIDLGVLTGDESSAARAISDTGLIAGESSFGVQQNRVTRFDGGAAALPTLSGAFTGSTRGINASGVTATVVQGDRSAAVLADDRAALATTSGVTQLFGAAGYAAAGAFDVANNGVAVGYSLVSGSIGLSAEGGLPVVPAVGGSERATIWSGSTTGTLLADPCGPVAACNSNAVSIGEDGQIAGIARMNAGNSVRAVRWAADGTPTILAIGTGETSSRAREIDDFGNVAGQVFGGDASIYGTGSVWRGVTQYLLPFADFVSTTTRGIANNGTVVGFGYQSIDDEIGFSDPVGLIWLWDGTSYTGFRLDDLVVDLGDARTFAVQAINNAGQIVGFGPNQSGDIHAYLLAAVPEPASWGLMIAGFGLTGASLRRRRTIAA